MRKVLLNGHQGLGDWMIYTGMVVHFSETVDEVVLLTSKFNYTQLKLMFKGYKNVKIQDDPIIYHEKVESMPDEWVREHYPEYYDHEILTLGFGNKKHILNYEHFDRSMYEQAGVDFEYSYSKFRINRDIHEENMVIRQNLFKNDVSFFHYSENFHIDEKYKEGKNWVLPSHYYHFTSWISFLQRCKEIHCIPSSFSCLVDRIELPLNPKLYLHVYSRPKSALPEYRKPWNYLY